MLCNLCLAFLSLAVLFICLEWDCSTQNNVKSGKYLTTETPVKVLSSHELALYDGQEGSRGLYLAILGQVFDIHKGYKHYGPDGPYHFMAGDFTVLITVKYKFPPTIPPLSLHFSFCYFSYFVVCVCVPPRI